MVGNNLIYIFKTRARFLTPHSQFLPLLGNYRETGKFLSKYENYEFQHICKTKKLYKRKRLHKIKKLFYI